MDAAQIVGLATGEEPETPVFNPLIEAETPVPDVPLLPRDVVIAQVNAMYRRAYDDSVEPRKKGRECRRLYNLDFKDEFKGKKDWQSKHELPTVFTAINFVANGLADAATGGEEDWLTLTGETPLGDVIAPVFRELIETNLDKEDFEGKFGPALVDGLLLGAPVFQVYPKGYQDDKPPLWRGYACVESSDMTRILRDPTGRGKFLLFVDVVDMADVERMAGERGFDIEEMEQLREANSRATSEDEEWRREWANMVGLDANSDLRKPVLLMEYYGPFWDADKRMVLPFGRCVIANKSALLEAPEPDPYGGQTVPFVHGDIIPRQGAAYGPSYASVATTLAKAKTRTFNMALDSLSRSTMDAVEMDKDSATPQAIQLAKDGNLAGAILLKTGPGELLRRTQLGTFHPEIIAVMQMIDQEYQAATNATDLNRGIPDQSGTADQTATEFKGKIQLSGQALRGVAKAVEKRTMEPLAEHILHYLQEFGSVDDPGVERFAAKGLEEARGLAIQYLANKAKQMLRMGGPPPPPPTDMDIHLVLQKAWGEKLSVRVSGISSVLDAQEEAQRLISVAGVVVKAQSPNEPPLVDPSKFARKLLKLSGFVADDILYSDEERQQMAQQQAMAQQEAARMQMMAAQGGP